MPFKESPEGETKFCIPCEIEERVKRGRKITIINEEDKIHTCGKIKNTKEDWEVEFDEKYGWLYRNLSEKNGKPIWFLESENVKKFIRSLLSKEKDACKTLLNSGRGMYEQGKKDEKSRIRENFVEKEELRRLFAKVKNYPSKLKDVITFLEDIKEILK